MQKFETRAAAEQLTLKQTDQLLKDVKLAVGTMGPLPTKQDREDLMVRLQAVRTAADAAHPGTARGRGVEALGQRPGAGRAVHQDGSARRARRRRIPRRPSNEMRTLQERWKAVAAAPRSQAEALWTRFKTAQEQVYEKCKDFFAQQAVERVENLKKKEALCEQAEALADSTDWVRTADAIKALQAEWKAIGPVTRGHEKAVWERFRAACDKFFTRRQDDLKQRKQDWTENLKRKEALVAEAEQLSQSTEWEQAASRIKRLQVEWKTIGPVKKSKSDAIWKQFRAACDLFFERFKNRDSGGADRQDGRSRNGRGRTRRRWCRRPTPTDAPRPTISTPRCRPPAPAGCRDRSCRATRWRRWPIGSTRRCSRWSRAGPTAFKGTDLDPELTRGQMEKLVAKVEKLLPDRSAEPAKNLSPAELLARQWREALAANTMGAGVGASGRRRAPARRRAGSAQRAGGLGPPGPVVAGGAQAAAGSLRSRGPEVPGDAAAECGPRLAPRAWPGWCSRPAWSRPLRPGHSRLDLGIHVVGAQWSEFEGTDLRHWRAPLVAARPGGPRGRAELVSGGLPGSQVRVQRQSPGGTRWR